jgi:hypothetical protein
LQAAFVQVMTMHPTASLCSAVDGRPKPTWFFSPTWFQGDRTRGG